MELLDVSKDLEARVSAGRAWFQSTVGSQMRGPLLRSRETSIQLREFLDAPNRAERYGLGFVVTVLAPKKPFSFQINIRIKPHRTAGSKVDSYPYVVSYVVDQSSNAEILISFDHITEPRNYASAVGLTVEDWYLRWLKLALERGDGKLFAPEVRISSCP